MTRYLLAALFMVFSSQAVAATVCICTAGCKVGSDSYAPGPTMPTSCNIYKSGVFVVAGVMVDAATIPTSNAAVCMPASLPYIPGVAGSMACVANIPAQASGTTVALTVRGVNATGEAVDGGVFTFQSVAALPPPARALRVTP